MITKHLGFVFSESGIQNNLLVEADRFVGKVREHFTVVALPQFQPLDRLQQVYRPVLELRVHAAPWGIFHFTFVLDSQELFNSALDSAWRVLGRFVPCLSG